MIIRKGWGFEDIIESNDLYCMKELHFEKKGHKSSMHFHKVKDETWKVLNGSIKIELMDMKDSSTTFEVLEKGQTIRIEPFTPHQVTCLEDNTVIMEVSSKDSPIDNYRIRPGDSQTMLDRSPVIL